MTLTPSELEILVGISRRVFHHCWRHALPLRGSCPVPTSLQACCAHFVRSIVVCGMSLLTSMTDVQASGTTCSGSDWSCLTVNTNAAAFFSDGQRGPSFKSAEAASTPIDMDGVEQVCVGFGCSVWKLGKRLLGQWLLSATLAVLVGLQTAALVLHCDEC